MSEQDIRTPNLRENSNVLQSSLITEARYGFTNLESKIFFIVIAAAQQDFRNMIQIGIRDGLRDWVVPEIHNNIQVKFFLRDFDMNGNEQDLVTAATNLVAQAIETKTQTGWIVQPPVAKAEYNRNERSVTLTISPEIWMQILDIRLGYSEYELLSMLRLKSKYSMRFYMIAAGIQDARAYTIADLRKQFKLEKKYSTSTNFLAKVVDVAKKELDEKAAVSFEYEKIKKPGTKEIVGIMIKPKRNPSNIDRDLEEKKLLHGKIQVGMSLDHEEIQWLRKKLTFTDAELNSNFGTFNTAKKVFGLSLLDEMNHIYEAMLRSGKGTQKGYFIRSLSNNTKTMLDKMGLQPTQNKN